MGLTSLVELHLEQNLISELPENTWIRNRDLEKLFLFSNNLEELNEKTFNGLVSLISLFLNNNILKGINSRVFIHTPSLQKLYEFFKWFQALSVRFSVGKLTVISSNIFHQKYLIHSLNCSQ